MIVPPFIPPPIEISGSVSEQPYPVMVHFVRRVVLAHSTTLLVVAYLAQISFTEVDVAQAWLTLIASLLALSFVRRLVKGRHWEMYGSSILLPLVILSLSVILNKVGGSELSPWTVIAGPLFASVYMLVCGRDLSFVGMLVASSLASGCLFFGLDVIGRIPRGASLLLWLGNTIYLSYFVYDLAMITRRRRKDEALGAVIDLYRDLANFLTYPVRVWSHWRKHRIWSQRLDLGDARALAWRAISKFDKRAKPPR